jgi:hypothetical protein
MNNWPPAMPDPTVFCGAFMHLKENIQDAVRQGRSSRMDRSLAQYLRTSNIGTRLAKEMDGAYKRQITAVFETVTERSIRPKLLRMFHAAPDECGVYIVSTDITHDALNHVTKKEAAVFADELVSQFYDQYAIARSMGISTRMLRDSDPHRYENQLYRIYEEIRSRMLPVLRNSD